MPLNCVTKVQSTIVTCGCWPTKMESSSERSFLLGKGEVYSSGITSTASTTKVEFKVYKRRWYVLFLYTSQAFIYNLAWNTWGPIQEPCKIAFGWTDFNLLLLSSWAAIAFLVTSAPLTWLMDTKGLRISVLINGFLSVVGKVLQVIPFGESKVRTIFINLGQFLVMAGGPVALGAPPLVSATWFPPAERTTATAIGSLGGYFGIAIAFVVGPVVVPKQVPASIIGNSSGSEKSLTLAKIMSDKITQYTYFELGLCTAVFLCTLLYFPSRPPLPPSLTSWRPCTLNTKASLRQVMKNGQFWLLGILAGLNFGIYFGWFSMLDVFLAKFKVDPLTAGWLGSGATFAGVVSGILLARCADYVKHRTKQLLMLLLTLSTISQLFFSLSCAGILPSTKPLLYSSIVVGGFVFNGALPLFFELVVECVYPVGEGIAGGILTTVANVVLLLFYVAFMLPHSDMRWMNWVKVTGFAVCVTGLLFHREKYIRLDLDSCINAERERDPINACNYKTLSDPI